MSLHSFLGSELDWSGQLHALAALPQNKIKINSQKNFLNMEYIFIIFY